MRHFPSHSAFLKAMAVAAAVAVAALYFLLLFGGSEDLFKGTPFSTVVMDRDGELLGARIADDGQWRFPPSDEVPERFAVALIQFEDRAFRWHNGVNYASLCRALVQDIRNRRVVSGGSTITMQLIRMSRGRERTVVQKCIEIVKARGFEMFHSKKKILALYASYAPFGGNVVGLEAASWRYFGHEAQELSWGEAATLAVLPNAPSYIHVGKNRELLLDKRNRLLERLFEKGFIDQTDYLLACEEPLPDAPLPLPQLAPHLVENAVVSGKGSMVMTTVDASLQKRVMDIASRWHSSLARQDVNDLAVVVLDVHTGDVLAYVGNADVTDERPGAHVDIVRSPRSTGSILKPFLYCALLQEGALLPDMILPDVPVNINGFSPQNFDLTFTGAVKASEALSRSLNVPSVHMLRRFGVPLFCEVLRGAGLTTITRSPSDYGLSLILGGAEGTLYDITSAYAAMSSILQQDKRADGPLKSFPLQDRLSIYYTFDALKEVNRPDEMDWKLISSVRKIAWKTGTSWGFRDAWAVGVDSDYAVGVWAGNALGNGSPALVGARCAGPVLCDVFNILPASEWFEMPYKDEYVIAEVCHQSGHLSGPWCTDIDTLMLPSRALKSEPCPYHKEVRLSPDGKWLAEPGEAGAVTVSMFVLPPSMEWYYRARHPEYETVPARRPGSVSSDGFVPMDFIYPENGSVISVPRQLDGSIKGVVFNLAHSHPETEVFWHLDDNYCGSTKYVHQMTMTPSEGHHSLTVVDASGNSLSVGFTVE